jgi:hypothetical protein
MHGDGVGGGRGGHLGMGEKRHADAPAAAFPRGARGILARLEAVPAGRPLRRWLQILDKPQGGRLAWRSSAKSRDVCCIGGRMQAEPAAAVDMHSAGRALVLDRLGFRLCFWNYWGSRRGKN